jgi:hypothetical protein
VITTKFKGLHYITHHNIIILVIKYLGKHPMPLWKEEGCCAYSLKVEWELRLLVKTYEYDKNMLWQEDQD